MFVDLASISAGENDLDVDRVACFHDAVLGYSSILYELKSDTGFSVFKEVLKKLWKALDNDPNLPKKLVRLPLRFGIQIIHMRCIKDYAQEMDRCFILMNAFFCLSVTLQDILNG